MVMVQLSLEKWVMCAGGVVRQAPAQTHARRRARGGVARALAGVLLLSALPACAPQPPREGGGTGQSRQRCSVEEVEALERLYTATGGAGWACGAPGRPCARTRLGADGEADGDAPGVAATWVCTCVCVCVCVCVRV